jgi:hypothetical protein
MPNPKFSWPLLWQGIITFCLMLLGEAVKDILLAQTGRCAGIDCRLFDVLFFILLLILSAAIVQGGWFAVTRISPRILKQVKTFTGIRPARVMVNHIEHANEIYIMVINLESWFRIEMVHADTEYAWQKDIDHPFRGRLKWIENSTEHTEETSINYGVCKTQGGYRLLHFATINKEKHNFNLYGFDHHYFPKVEGKYTFPITLEGSMYFLWFKISRVILKKHFEVVVIYDGDNPTVSIQNGVDYI